MKKGLKLYELEEASKQIIPSLVMNMSIPLQNKDKESNMQPNGSVRLGECPNNTCPNCLFEEVDNRADLPVLILRATLVELKTNVILKRLFVAVELRQLKFQKKGCRMHTVSF